MRILAWNIRAGGGKRVEGILSQIRRWQPDVVGLCEYRATPPSLRLAEELAHLGLRYQETTARADAPRSNSLLLASRWPLSRLSVSSAPTEPGRWLMATIDADEPFVLALMHIPNMVSGRKLLFLDAVHAVASEWRHGPAVFLGDTNCGWPGIDEERPVFGLVTKRWLDSLADLGWQDAFRHLKAEDRFYTWYSPNAGNGFRLDQAFLNREMIGRLMDVSYSWGTLQDAESPRREALSDHAALLLDLARTTQLPTALTEELPATWQALGISRKS